jgi:F-type H+-transporting ATPase subunit alpha
LIIGDRQSGKSTLALDAIISQKGRGVVCVYCWIGGAESGLKKHVQILGDAGALDHTVIVAASADQAAAVQYIAPYAAAAVGEYFMDRGRDVLVIFDDLTKHAWIYRQISLLLDRSPGREAYPGDIFYLHSQLLERAARLKPELGNGSMTFLPVVETLQGDISGYIQTNLVSITDGQIYVSAALFKEGFRPAIDLGLSVSRIGSKVQNAAVKSVSKGLRLEYAQYRQMLKLTKLRTRMSQEAEARLKRGAILSRLLSQPNNRPVTPEEQVVLFHMFGKKYLELLDDAAVRDVVENFFAFYREQEPMMVEMLRKDCVLSSVVANSIDMSVRLYLRAKKTGSLFMGTPEGGH